MRRIDLQGLWLTNFRGFRKAALVFPTRGVVLVEGKVAATGESSGAGKSSLLGAISYALGYGDCPGSRNVSRSRPDEPMEACLGLRVGILEGSVTRGTEGLSVVGAVGACSDLAVAISQADGPKKGRAAEELLAKWLPPREFMAAMTYRPQRSVGYFLSLPAGERLSFLSAAQGLDRYEAGLESLKKLAGSCADISVTARAALRQAEEVERIRTDAVQRSVGSSADELAAAQADLLAALVPPQLEPVPDVGEREDLVQWLQDMAGARARKVQVADQLIQQLEVATRLDPKGEVESRARDLESRKKAVCSQCGQNLPAALIQLEQSQYLLNQAQAALVAYEQNRLKLQGVRQFRDQVQRPDAEEVAFRERLAALTPIAEAVTARNETATIAAQQRVLAARQRVEVLATKAAAADRAQNDLEAAKARVAELAGLLVNAEKREAEAADAAEALKAFLLAYLRDFLADLTNRVNATISPLPNMAGITLRFASSRQLKNGQERGEIGVFAIIDGQEYDLREKPISGGQLAAAELATDLDLGQILAERTGVQVGWRVFDEPFGGLTQKTKEECLTLLRDRADRDGLLILLVDHDEAFKAMFDQRIEVVAGPDFTTIEVKIKE